MSKRPFTRQRRKMQETEDLPLNKEVKHLGNQLTKLFRSKSFSQVPTMQILTLKANYAQKKFEELGSSLQNLQADV